ncbi:hypothetical protein SISSUDRAFT_978243 [Sistotremastrum suecicum HHB10207 ss-3]|uniref:BSD domain-containing protein n=1 Tax=Sistotremastrum suecicum HHB10207 ss-3 TaxID=1314776 RepID=A0A166I7N6_9AGAM|nr:hypothetical protein SISSUDRAFT_978243 [Sistotremastrum suecicum HHB10207 ss-3]
MNTLDLFDFETTTAPSPKPSDASGSSSSEQPSSSAASPQPSLNEEVNQVIGQLGRFWGGVRKQSASAFEIAKKDIGSVVTQAQKELGKLAEPSPPTVDRSPDDQTPSASSSSSSVASAANGLLARLQHSLPPNVSETFQKHLHDAQESQTLRNLRASVTENMHRIQEQTQGMTLAQAEEFVQHRSEALLKEAGDFFREAIKVVPPEEATAATGGAIWDGSDVWMLPDLSSSSNSTAAPVRSSSERSRVLGKRLDVLLARLRSDPDIVRVDPSADANQVIKDAYETWLRTEVDSKGGLASDHWKARITQALDDKEQDGDALKSLLDMPSELNADQFWTRYFFRLHQIEVDEERRKAVLQGAAAQGTEEVFSWEDEDDETTHPGANASTTSINRTSSDNTTPIAVSPLPESVGMATSQSAATSHSASPRDSEDSYEHMSQVSRDAASPQPPATQKTIGSSIQDDDDSHDGDSDWE